MERYKEIIIKFFNYVGDKMSLSEADTREKLVIPKLKESEWTEENIIREYKIKATDTT
jgi:hypothetical protein